MKLDLKKEQIIKLLLAIWIIISHLPIFKPLTAYNYLPVAGFFFLSGYGLMTKSKNNSKFNCKKSILKIYIPYIIASIVFTLIFEQYSLLIFLKQIFLINVDLPYGWYIRTQIIIYVFWGITNRLKNDNHKIALSFILLCIYICAFRYTNQIMTSYKTVFAFIFGLLYVNYESKIYRYINRYTSLIGCIGAILLRLVISSDETILNMLLYNISGIIFCIPLIYVILKININIKLLDYLQKYSLDFYLVQGISQCFVMKTNFCNKSFLYIENKILILCLSFFGTIILGILLKEIKEFIFKIIYRRNEEKI